MSDSILRQKISALARMSAEDRDAILDQLDPAEQRIVLCILDTRSGTQARHVFAHDASGLSPWLRRKIAELPSSSPIAALAREALGRLDGPPPAPVSLVSRTSAFIARKVL